MTNEERQQAIEWLKRRPVMMAGAKRMYDLAIEALEAYVPDMNDGNMEPSRESDTEITRCSDDTISRKAAIDALDCINGVEEVLRSLPSAQPTNEMLERCRFEYIHACKIVSIPTPDVTGKDKQDAYAVIKALQPIFGDVTF